MSEGCSSSSAAPAVGSRVILFGKHRATVRFLGAVEGQAGQWVGIEYDDPSAGGKHDGSHAGRRYFHTAHPTAGSLVKLAKFLEAADPGRSLAAAAHERYGSENGASGSADAGSSIDSSSSAQQLQQQKHVLLPTALGSGQIAVELVAPAAGPGAAARRQSAGGGMAAALVAHRVSSVVSRQGSACVLGGSSCLERRCIGTESSNRRGRCPCCELQCPRHHPRQAGKFALASAPCRATARTCVRLYPP